MFTFNGNVLSAEKYSPRLISATLSSTGIEYLSGSQTSPFAFAQVVLNQCGPDTLGIAFNKTTIYSASLTAIPAIINTDRNLVTFALDATSVFIPKALNNTVMTLIKRPTPSVIQYNTFTFLSASGATVFVSLCTLDQNVSTPNKRRLRNLGYA